MKTLEQFLAEGKTKKIFYTVHGDSDIKIGNKVMRSHEDFDKHFPASEYGNHRFEMVDKKTGKRFDGEEDFSHAEIRKDLSKFGSKIK